MQIPIVLFHKSEKYYVSCALRAAKAQNKDVTIITDVTPKMYTDYAKVEDFSDYKSQNAEQFATIYQHFSTNPHYFEFTAIEKYFFLLEHMKKHQLEKMLYIDSDLLLYGNMTEIISKYYDSFDVCSCISEQNYEDFYWTASGHLSLWTYQALEEFCKFILKAYTEDNQVENLKRKWQFHIDNKLSGGICDMTLVYLFLKETKLKTGNFLNVVENTFSFDNAMKGNIGEFQDEYKMEYSFLLGDIIKKIRFKDGYPYAYNKILQKNILLYCLHCQAEAKRLMPMLVKDKKTIKELLSDNIETIKFFYGALKRDISRKILRRNRIKLNPN